jgi:hypothetical protein
MVLWVVREQARETGEYGHERVCDALTVGTYTSIALARAAVAMRLRNLYAGGDCFATPCPDGLDVYQHWHPDGTGSMALCVKPPAEGAARSYYDFCRSLKLTIETQELDVSPVLDRRPGCWEGLEDAAGYIRPPPPPPPPPTATAEEHAAYEAWWAAQEAYYE